MNDSMRLGVWSRIGIAFSLGIVTGLIIGLSFLLPKQFSENLSAIAATMSAVIAAAATYFVWRSAQSQQKSLEIQDETLRIQGGALKIQGEALADQKRGTDSQIEENRRATEVQAENAQTQERILRSQLTVALLSVEKEIRELSESFTKSGSRRQQLDSVKPLYSLFEMKHEVLESLGRDNASTTRGQLEAIKILLATIDELLALSDTHASTVRLEELEGRTSPILSATDLCEVIGNKALNGVRQVIAEARERAGRERIPMGMVDNLVDRLIVAIISVV